MLSIKVSFYYGTNTAQPLHLCLIIFVLDNATIKLIHKRKTAENARIKRLFSKKKKTEVSYENFGLYLANDRNFDKNFI